MNRNKVTSFPPARQREAFRRTQQGPFRPLPKDIGRSAMGWPAFAIITLAACSALFAAIWFSSGPPASHSAAIDPHRASFGICFGATRTNCVVDGDTFWFEGRKIRIADINTPEISSPGCAAEKRLGERAKMRLLALLNADSFALQSINRDQDQYGRALRIVTRSGQSLGAQLVDEGLAEEWRGFRRDWC